MDGSKPFRHLLPLGIISLSALTGCVTAPAYRPVATAEAPARPMDPFPAAISGTSGSLANGPVPYSPPPIPPAPPAASLATPMPPAPPVSIAEPAPTTGPALSIPNSEPAASPSNAPMGVPQMPLAPPTAPPAELVPEAAAPPVAPQLPGDAASAGQSSVSMKVDVDAGSKAAVDATTQTPPPAKKPKPPKKPDPPLSPLARLRKRFQSFTHPAPKPTPKKDGEVVTATTPAVTGPRVPLPTADVAIKVQTPPIHGLYAADDPKEDHAVADSAPAPRVEPSMQVAGEQHSSPAGPSSAPTAKPAEDGNVEQWPGTAPSVAVPRARTSAGLGDDFTAISDDEYRATVAKIEPPYQPAAIVASSKQPTANPTTDEKSARSPERDGQPRSTSGIPSAPPVGQQGAWMVIPQAAPRVDRLSPPIGPAELDQNRLTSAQSPASIHDLVSGAPAPAMPASPPQASTIERISNPSPNGTTLSEPNPNPAAMINSDWALPQSVYAPTASTPRPRIGISAPATPAQSGNAGRSTANPKPTVAVPAQPASSAVPIQRAATSPPVLVNGPNDAPHGGS
jgi:hypothetical protein